MNDDPHHHFRERIDTLTDQRDAALELADTRLQRIRRVTTALYKARRSRELWRQRAMKRAKR